MQKITLKYDPYKNETEFHDDGHDRDDFLDSMDGKEISLWCEEFIRHLVDVYNDDIAFDFYGIERDCDTVEDAVKNFNKSNNNVRVTLRRFVDKDNSSITSSKTRIENLRELYAMLKSDSCPFPELRNNKNIEDSFNKALDREFEIAVVATMSSGKSTLINAMLGNEILPARNEATTATIARIHDIDNADHFTGRSFDEAGQEIACCDPLTLDNMNDLNNNPRTARVEVYGDILGISSQSIKLVLTDTPGPNNSRTQEHKNHTYSLIRDSKYKPMVLYILNGTQLETNDDNSLLNDIAEAMRESGRQASDRFIFVLNKADEFDSEKESVKKKVEDTKKYLESHGINNPKVFPCSAKMAKLIRQSKAGYPLSRKEQRDLNDIDYFLDDPSLHFNELAEVSENVHSKLISEIANAKAKGDEYQEVLIYTGIPTIEYVISEYLIKYAEPQKISEALHSFMQIIKDLGTESKETELLKGNQSKVNETKAALKRTTDIINEGKKGSELKSKIDALSVRNDVMAAYKNISGPKISSFIEAARRNYCSNKLTEAQTKDRIQNIQQDLADLRNKFAVDIEELINTKVGAQAQNYADEYNRYVSELLGEAFGHNVKSSSVLGSLANMQLDSQDIIDFEFDIKEQTGVEVVTEIQTKTETREIQKTRKREKDGFFSGVARFFGGLFDTDWGYEDYTVTEQVPVEVDYEVQVEKPKFENRTYVNFTQMFNNLVIPLIDEFTESAGKIALETAVEEEQKLKQAFRESFDALNEAIHKKLEEKQRMLSDEEELERKVEQSKKNLQWLSDFNGRLERCLKSN